MSAPVAEAERVVHPLGQPRPEAPAARVTPPAPTPPHPAAAVLARWWPALAIAAILAWAAFLAGGGLNLRRMTVVEMALTIGCALAASAAVLAAPVGGRAYGAWPLGLLVVFAGLSAISVVWSVQPDASWQDAGRMLAYSAVFGAAIALVRVAPSRWSAVLGGVVLAAVVVCGWALLTKVFPAQLDARDPYARLRAPYSYWNAIGLTAAMGAIGCLWLGARRSGHALLSALAYPAMGLMLLTLLLAYSRGALVALVLGAALWFAIVPLRLRGAAVLLAGAGAAAAVVAWAFSRHALSSDYVALGARSAAGHQLGVLVLVMLVALALAGMGVGFFYGRRAPSPRARRLAGGALIIVLALSVLTGVGALAASHRGLTGSVSHGFNRLTDPHAPVPPNTPGRLTAIASVRARYWNEALKVFKAHPALGSGAEGYATARLRYRTETLAVRHAHGYVVQTLADLGLLGLAVTLALLLAWMAACGRCTHPFNRRLSGWRSLWEWRRGGPRPGWRHEPLPYGPERVGLLTMLALVVVFGIHSLADWTWYVPGDACVALLCAGWLAGRGPLAAGPAGRSEPAAGGPGERASGTRAGAPLRERHVSPDGFASALWRRRGGWRALALHSLEALRSRPLRLAIACAALIAALLAAWAEWQPQRSSDASQHALSALARDPAAAEQAAHAAVGRDPLSAQALLALAAVQRARGRPALARATLQRSVRLQPSNPQTWLALGEYDLSQASALAPSASRRELARTAASEIAAGIYLNPELRAPQAIAAGNRESITAQNAYVQALRAATPPPAAPASPVRRGRSRSQRQHAVKRGHQ